MNFFEKALLVFKFEVKMLLHQVNNYLTEGSQVNEKFTRASYENSYFIPPLNTSNAQRSMIQWRLAHRSCRAAAPPKKSKLSLAPN